MKIAIVDDNIDDSSQIELYINKFINEENIKETVQIFKYIDGESFLRDLNNSFSLIFLDVEMPNILGIDVAKRIRSDGYNIPIVFITNLAQYAINGYEVEALDYLLKPLSYSFFNIKFKKIIGIIKRNEVKNLIIKIEDKEKIKVSTENLYYIEVISHYLYYHLKSNEIYKSRGTISDIEKELKEFGFSRSSKSFIVNLRKIKSIKGNVVYLDNNDVAYISRGYKDSFIKDFNNFIGGNI